MFAVRTEEVKTGTTNYGNTIGHHNNTDIRGHLAKKKCPAHTTKPNEIDISRRNYNPPVRHFNRAPKFEKNFKTVCLEMNRVDQRWNEKDIRKNLNKIGVNPIKLKLDKNTLSHAHKGKGMIVIESSGDGNRVKKTTDLLKSLNIDIRPARNFDPINK